MIITKSKRLFESAQEKIPGGVNSPVRAWQAVTGVPRFIMRGKGAHVIDVDGNEYIDYVGSWGPLILGHAHPYVIGELRDALLQGTTFGAPTERELQIGRHCLPFDAEHRKNTSGEFWHGSDNERNTFGTSLHQSQQNCKI